MFEIIVNDKFSAAHKIYDYPGHCANLHGHNWRIELRLKSDRLNKIQMAIDFTDAKKILHQIVEKFDHSDLNNNEILAGENPTAEVIAITIYNLIKKEIPSDVNIKSVTVWESENNGVLYYE